ncbi:MAG: type IV pilus biogenesis/stability protein PilW [Burkholderiales bacterium]|nr:type IV pilus biogenesis/stability protein PilW [Burkholderiales bacterium]
MIAIERLAILLIGAAFAAGCATDTSQGGGAGAPAGTAAREDTAALIQQPGDPRTRAKAHTDLASAYYGIGSMGIALEEARVAIAADPTYAPAYNVQALVHMDLKDNAAAETSFQRGLKISPNDADLNHNYGWFLCQTGREQQAMAYFTSALRNPLYTTPSRTYAAAGRCLLQRNEVKEAGEFFERALRLDPNSVSVLLPYARVQYDRGRFAEARELVARYSRLAPPSAEALWLAVRVERKLGDKVAESSYAAQLRLRFPRSLEYQALQRGEFE